MSGERYLNNQGCVKSSMRKLSAPPANGWIAYAPTQSGAAHHRLRRLPVSSSKLRLPCGSSMQLTLMIHDGEAWFCLKRESFWGGELMALSSDSFGASISAARMSATGTLLTLMTLEPAPATG